MKKTLLVLVFLVLLTFTPAFAWGQQNDTSSTKSGQKQQERQEQKTATIQERAKKEIERRVSSLNKLISRVNEIKRLSADQKAGFTAQVQAEINNLNSLATKIAADTNPATIKTDTQSIVKSYRVYALYIPQLHLLAAGDVGLQAIDTLNGIAAKLQARITDAASNGQDVTALEAAYTDMQTKINNAKTLIGSMQASVLALTPEGYPTNKTTLEAARKTLQTIHTDLQQARKDIQIIIQGTNGLKTKAKPNLQEQSKKATSSGNPVQ